jgi:hypothetical protein
MRPVTAPVCPRPRLLVKTLEVAPQDFVALPKPMPSLGAAAFRRSFSLHSEPTNHVVVSTP